MFLICKKCGARLEEDALFCGICGNKAEPDYENNAAENSDYEFVRRETPLSSKKTSLIMQRNLLLPIVIAIAVIMTVTASFLAFKLLRDNDNSETPSDIGNEQKIKTDTAADDETVHNSPSLPEEYEIDFDESKDYIYPSDREYLDKSQLENLTKEEVALLRNEIYARRGYVFNSEEYKKYFSSKPWYVPNENFDESMFNPIEKANKDLIVEYETEMEWR